MADNPTMKPMKKRVKGYFEFVSYDQFTKLVVHDRVVFSPMTFESCAMTRIFLFTITKATTTGIHLFNNSHGTLDHRSPLTTCTLCLAIM